MRANGIANTLAVLLLIGAPSSVIAQPAGHPMDELTAAEHWALYETLMAHDTVTADAEVLYAGLHRRRPTSCRTTWDTRRWLM